MVTIAAILAIDLNYGLGYQNNILFRDPVDMKHFRTTTCQYKNCIVGRKTADSLPQNFPGRKLKILTRNPPDSFQSPLSYKNILDCIEDQIVIGGNEIYKLFKDDVDIWYLTQFKKSAELVDTYLDKSVIDLIDNTSNTTREVILENDDLIISKITKLR